MAFVPPRPSSRAIVQSKLAALIKISLITGPGLRNQVVIDNVAYPLIRCENQEFETQRLSA